MDEDKMLDARHTVEEAMSEYRCGSRVQCR